ncbi:MAG: hypothetical protein IJ299_05415 [Oscillospiraceae bacterium]|nr:hypothetical protein [Oscillospiraceae bacterium]
MTILNLLTVSLGAVLAENLVFSRFLGTETFFSDTKNTARAVRRGIAVGIFLTAASLIAYILNALLLAPAGLEYMRTFIFVLVLGAGVKICENVLGRRFPEKYEKLGISFDSVCFSSAFLGVMLICTSHSYTFFEALFFGIFSGAGYILSSLILSAIRENLEYTDCPKFLKGEPMLFITLGLIALAFMGFSGMKFI